MSIKDIRNLVAIIGDGWVSRSKMDDGIRDAFQDVGTRTFVKSDGIPNGSITQIRKRFFSNRGMLRILSENYINMNKSLIIVAGIHDIVYHLGAQNYVDNINEIAEGAHDLYVKVYVVEIPSFIEIPLKNVRPLTSRLRRTLNCYRNDGGKANVLEDYRQTLREKRYSYIKLINPDSFLDSTNPHLYMHDGIHLWSEVYDHFGVFVGEEIINLQVQKLGKTGIGGGYHAV